MFKHSVIYFSIKNDNPYGLLYGLDWIGLDWIGLDWIGLDWIIFSSLQFYSISYCNMLTGVDFGSV